VESKKGPHIEMDKQRAAHVGLANAFFVLYPELDAATELLTVQNELRKLYNGIDKCLCDPKTFHMTLVGSHVACLSDFEMLGKALSEFVFPSQACCSDEDVLEGQDLEGALSMRLQGLGAWTTVGGKNILFADLKNAKLAKRLAASLSKHLVSACKANEADGTFGDGSWIDIVTEDLFQPHLTVAVIDPRESADVWRAVQAKSGAAGKKKRDQGKKKLSSREKGMREGRREQMLDQRSAEEGEDFGFDAKLFAHERHAFKKIVFGELDDNVVSLEYQYQVKFQKRLN
jgi:2'-5' RNA ligase